MANVREVPSGASFVDEAEDGGKGAYIDLNSDQTSFQSSIDCCTGV